MSRSLLLIATASVCVTACDKRPPLEERYGETSSKAAASATASTSAAPKPTASAKKRQMPPRPVPIGSSGPIQPTDPPEKQMMAIQYTLAMLAPQPEDPVLDRDAIDALAKKMSAGGVKAVPEKGHRLLTLNIKTGCTADVPKRMARTRGGVSLEQLYAVGVNVIKCHGRKWACHQSTRDPKDVLCHAAPR